MNSLRRTGLFTLSLVILWLSSTAADAQPGLCEWGRITIGQTVSNALEGDCYPDVGLEFAAGSDLWYFAGTAGDQVVIDMVSTEFDAYLWLNRIVGGGELQAIEPLTSDDDGGDANNARIIYTLPFNGMYIIAAGSYSQRSDGEYTLSLQYFDCRETNFALEADNISSGVQVSGSLSSCADDRWWFYGTAGETATITMIALTAFDPYLSLLDANGQQIAANDDGGDDTLNSEISLTLPYTGSYSIIAAGFGLTDMGRYSLLLELIQQACTLVVNSRELNLRSGPSTNYSIIALYLQGTTGEVLGYNNVTQGQWWLVRLNDGRVGWFSGNPISGGQGNYSITRGNCANVPFVLAPPLPPTITPLPPTWTPTVTPSHTPTAMATATATATITPSPTNQILLADLTVQILTIEWPNGDNSQITLRLEVGNRGDRGVVRARVEVQPEFEGWGKVAQAVYEVRPGEAKKAVFTLDVPQAARSQIVNFVASVSDADGGDESDYRNNTHQRTFDLRMHLPDTGGAANPPSWLPVVLGGTVGLVLITGTGEIVRRRRNGHQRKLVERTAQEQLELPCKKGQIAYRKRKFTPEFSLLKITEVVMEVSLPNAERVLWQRTLNDDLAEELTAAMRVYRTTHNREHAAQMLAPTAVKLLHHVFSSLAREDGFRDVVISAQAEGGNVKVEYTRCRCEGQGQYTRWRELEDWEHEVKDEREKKIVKLRNVDPRDAGMPARLSRDMVEWLLHFMRRI